MYPPLFVSDIKENKRDESNIDKKLCKELCGVFTCLSCVCVLYLIFFTHVINDEIGMNMTLF
tara:strand:+ start:288 stop:473 length:186 start_codon:yes stop_codon:yes gene_type:complete